MELDCIELAVDTCDEGAGEGVGFGVEEQVKNVVFLF